MSEQTPQPSGSRAAGEPSSGPPPADWRDQTTPGITTVRGDAAGSAKTTGSGAHGYAGPSENYYTTPQYSTQPVAVRRPDPLAALLLILAGIAAGVSLLLHWLPDKGATGWDLLKAGFDDFGHIFSTGLWQPMVILLGGGALFVLGLLLLVPARAHRFFGLLALLVSLGVTAGVLVPLADADWRLTRFGLGFWFAIAVAALGLLGSLKALLTGPKYATTTPTTTA